MKTIWKYPLELVELQSLGMPRASKLLDVQAQDGHLYLWAKVDTKERLVERRFRVVGTGEKLEERALGTDTYLATVQTGSFVWHIFTL